MCSRSSRAPVSRDLPAMLRVVRRGALFEAVAGEVWIVLVGYVPTRLALLGVVVALVAPSHSSRLESSTTRRHRSARAARRASPISSWSPICRSSTRSRGASLRNASSCAGSMRSTARRRTSPRHAVALGPRRRAEPGRRVSSTGLLLKTLLREPLVHFLLLGAALFLVDAWLARPPRPRHRRDRRQRRAHPQPGPELRPTWQRAADAGRARRARADARSRGGAGTGRPSRSASIAMTPSSVAACSRR